MMNDEVYSNDLKYKDHIKACLYKDSLLRRQHPEFPDDDEFDYMLLRGEITVEQHKNHVVHELDQVTAWFEDAPKLIDKAFNYE